MGTSEMCVQGGIWIQVAVYVFCGPILQTAIMGVTNLVLDIRPSTLQSRPLHHMFVAVTVLINMPVLLFIFCFAADGDDDTSNRILMMLVAGVVMRYAVKPLIQMFMLSRSITSIGPELLEKWKKEFVEMDGLGESSRGSRRTGRTEEFVEMDGLGESPRGSRRTGRTEEAQEAT